MSARHVLGRRKATLSMLLVCVAVAGSMGATGITGAAPASEKVSPHPMRATSVFGTTGAGPNSVVIDTAGNIYTSDSRASTVTKITPGGTSTTVGTTGKQPTGIALDAAGNLYTSNIGDNTVTKITPAGVSSVLGTTGKRPMGIKVDAMGNVYTTNYIDSTVTKITPAGASRTLAATGRHPLGIVLDRAGNVYTANEGADSVTRITPDGVASVFGATGGWPQAIAIDEAGNLYTANWNTADVSKISANGVSRILGTTGDRPIGITLDSAGNVYTTNNGANNVSRISPSGTSRIVAVTDRRPSGITVDSSGNLFAANFASNTVTKISAGKATRSTVVSISTVTVASPGNAAAWIIPFYNDVYETQASCLAALPGVRAIVEAAPDPAVQKDSATSCMAVGAVPYTYNIGEMEITNAQWVTFLNTADPMGVNRHHLWDVAESSEVWPKYGSINLNRSADPGHRYSLSAPGWANRPYNTADFSRAARFVNSLHNGKVLSEDVNVVTTVSGALLKTTTYTVRLSPVTETGMYTMSNRKATRNSTRGFALTSQNEWIKAAYFDPKGGGKFSYWDYPTNPGQYVNCTVDVTGCQEGEQPNATQMDASGNVMNAESQPLATYEATPGVAPDWCPVVYLTADECTANTPFPPVLSYNGNVSPVGQALTRSPWGTLDQGGNVVETLDTISPPPALGDPKIVWRRWHGGVVTATAYQMWTSAVGATPQTVPGYAINPWRGLRISFRR